MVIALLDPAHVVAAQEVAQAVNHCHNYCDSVAGIYGMKVLPDASMHQTADDAVVPSDAGQPQDYDKQSSGADAAPPAPDSATADRTEPNAVDAPPTSSDALETSGTGAPQDNPNVAEIQQMIATVKGKLAAMKLEREELMKQVEKEKANGHLPGPTGHGKACNFSQTNLHHSTRDKVTAFQDAAAKPADAKSGPPDPEKQCEERFQAKKAHGEQFGPKEEPAWKAACTAALKEFYKQIDGHRDMSIENVKQAVLQAQTAARKLAGDAYRKELGLGGVAAQEQAKAQSMGALLPVAALTNSCLASRKSHAASDFL